MKSRSSYPRLARLTLERHLNSLEPDQDLPKQVLGDDQALSVPQACFVSIKTKSGDLRGCIGTIMPTQAALAQEIMVNAVSAAIRDPRFEPMTADELAETLISVDVLNPPEPVQDLNDLDPAVWGVIVSKNGRRGLLLPDLEGVDTVERQLTIAAQKAGIFDLSGLTVQRFKVVRHHESQGRDD